MTAGLALARVRLPARLAVLALLLAGTGGACAPAPARPGAGASGWASPAAGPTCVPPADPATGPAGTGSQAGTGSPAVPASVPDRLPDLSLRCLGSAQAVPLRALGRTVIINLWASWCQPCRTEMPVLARFAASHPGRLTVLGVDTGDTADAALPLLAARGVTYPVLADERRMLLAALGRSALPVTVFVAADGGIRYLYDTGVLDDQRLADLARTYLGIAS